MNRPDMQRITRLLLVIVAMVATSGPAAAATYDLAACVERGLRMNPEIASRKIAIQEIEKELPKAGNLFLPTITLSSQVTNLNNANAVERNNDYLDQESKTANLRLTQPLFTGFTGLNTLQKVKFLKEYRQTELREAEAVLTRDIHRQYFDFLRLSEEVAANRETIAGLEKQLAAAQAFYAQGMAARQQVLQVEVRLASARQDLLQVRTQAANSRLRLNNLLAEESGAETEFSGQLVDFTYTEPRPLAEYLQLAEKRPDLRLVAINIELSKRESKLIMARALPQLNLEANYNDHTVDYDQDQFLDEGRDYWSLGLNVSLNLFRGGADIAAYSQQLLAASRYEEERRKLRGRIEMQVHATFASMQEARQRIDSAFAIRELATASLEAAWARFKTGVGTTVEVLDAQEDVRRALIGIAKARTDFQLARADLDYLTGQGEEK